MHPIPISFTNDDDSPYFCVAEEQLIKLTQDLAAFLGITNALSLRLVDASEMQALNAEFRGKDTPTDVLSFPQVEWKKPQTTTEKGIIVDGPFFTHMPLGDIVICLERAFANAQNIGHGIDREVCFLITHSLLHLCGHDHQEPEEEARMCHEQNEMIHRIPASAWQDCVKAVELCRA